ncbi:MAG: D-glycero-beta-D-manno-heptose 1-phosphate adenylyltransferase [Chitinophagaceae bacterium]|nr:MAG: D-glycero-beta-D-manno-heptose 1-phosphate adenylyltransferase [Chitinophagaceae bacterium]
MKNVEFVQRKIYNLPDLLQAITILRLQSKSISFTNGCFDILHKGHIASLSDAAREADFLVVGINSDASTKRLKGEGRPVNNQDARALLLASLAIVDAVILFDTDTPLELINAVKPDVLVKGGDYTLEHIVGAKEVQSWGGRVVINPIVEGYSTTGILDKISKL